LTSIVRNNGENRIKAMGDSKGGGKEKWNMKQRGVRGGGGPGSKKLPKTRREAPAGGVLKREGGQTGVECNERRGKGG